MVLPEVPILIPVENCRSSPFHVVSGRRRESWKHGERRFVMAGNTTGDEGSESRRADTTDGIYYGGESGREREDGGGGRAMDNGGDDR
jgi:hypothetical protein